MTTSIRRAARATRRTPMSRSAAASRRRTRCCGGEACSRQHRRLEVTSTMHRLLGLLLIAAGIVLGTATAEAHPHVWITAKSEVVYAPDGSITGVRHAWTFDEMFTTYALQGL